MASWQPISSPFFWALTEACREFQRFSTRVTRNELPELGALASSGPETNTSRSEMIFRPDQAGLLLRAMCGLPM